MADRVDGLVSGYLAVLFGGVDVSFAGGGAEVVQCGVPASWTFPPANLLARQGRLAAVIDFGGLGVGDPACDVLPAWILLTAHTRDLCSAPIGRREPTG